MLNELPKDVWTNPNLKWLDPAVGIGNFPVIVYLKLMKGLEHWQSDEEKRRKYILEKMIYMVEISEKSIFILNKVFCGIDGSGQYKLNIYDKSFIEKEYNPDIKFDIIMGNPPYNPPKGLSGKSSGNSIWQNFVMKSFYMLSDNGYLVYIHPPGWKKPTLDIYREKLFLETNDYTKQIRQGQVWQVLKNHGAFNYIYSNDQKSKHVEYINYFPAVDYYVYQKNGDKSYCNTKSIFNGKIYESTNVKLNYDLYYLPMLITEQTQHILKNIVNKNDNKLSIKADRKLAFGKNLFNDDKYKYKYLYSTKKGGVPIYAYSDIKLDNVEKNKVIFNLFGGIDGYYIEYISSEMNLGSAHQSGFMVVDNKNVGENIVKTFKSDIIKFIFLITQYSSGMRTQNESIVANSISIPPTDFNGDLYEFYGIKKYQKYIDEVLNDYDESVKPKTKNIETKKKLVTVSVPSNLFKTPKSSKSIKTFKKRNDPKNGKQQIFNEKTGRWNTDTEANRKKILTQKK